MITDRTLADHRHGHGVQGGEAVPAVFGDQGMEYAGGGRNDVIGERKTVFQRHQDAEKQEIDDEELEDASRQHS
jgi:hypothetical protein